MNELLIMFLAVVGFNLSMFVPAYIYKTDKLTDISYALSFIALVLFALIRSEQRPAHVFVSVLVALWGFRLGGFLLMRVWKKGKDQRFDQMRNNFLKFLRFWVLQGVTVFVVMVSALLLMRVNEPKLNIVSILGAVIFLKGLAIEAVADMQKWRFSQDVKNKGKWIESGIWGWSRHPNYLGEMLVWIGAYFVAFPALQYSDRLWALVSPVYIIVLLMFVSGIPLLEKSADKKWGQDKDYQAYKKRVPVILPRIK